MIILSIFWALSIQPKIPEISIGNQMERTIWVRSDRNIWDYLVLYFGRSDRNVPFHDEIVVPSTALLYPAYKNNNQTRNGLGRVCATGMYRSNGHVEFPKFQTGIIAEWKAPYKSMSDHNVRP